MNTKTVKRLRKELNYKPNQPRNYIKVEGNRVKVANGRQYLKQWSRTELAETDPRAIYQKAKKEV